MQRSPEAITAHSHRNATRLPAQILSYEQKFAILRKRPRLVAYYKFEFVYMITDLVEHRSHGIMICHSTLLVVYNPVGNLAGLDHCGNMLLDESYMRRYLLYKLDVLLRSCVGTVGRKHGAHLVSVVDKQRLVLRGNRNDMIHRKVAENTALNLDFLRIYFRLLSPDNPVHSLAHEASDPFRLQVHSQAVGHLKRGFRRTP